MGEGGEGRGGDGTVRVSGVGRGGGYLWCFHVLVRYHYSTGTTGEAGMGQTEAELTFLLRVRAGTLAKDSVPGSATLYGVCCPLGESIQGTLEIEMNPCCHWLRQGRWGAVPEDSISGEIMGYRGSMWDARQRDGV